MRALTNGFLFFGYVFLAMTAGAFLWRAGLGLGPGVAATFGVLGVFAAAHAIISGSNDKKALRSPRFKREATGDNGPPSRIRRHRH